MRSALYMIAGLVTISISQPSAMAEVILPMNEQDSCGELKGSLPRWTPEQMENLRARSERPNDSGLGLRQLASKINSIEISKFHIAQCELRRQGKPYNRECPLSEYPYGKIISQLPSKAFTLDKLGLQKLLKEKSAERTRLSKLVREVCNQ